MRIFITGMSGFIGGFLAESLVSQGHEVSGSYWKEETLYHVESVKDRVRLFHLDIRDYEQVLGILRKTKPEQIYHLAAQSYPMLSFPESQQTLETNVIGTDNMFRAILELKLGTSIVVAGSSAEYGFVDQREMPVKETHSLKPLHPYGVSKVATELLAYQYAKNFGIDAKTVRIFNTIGPRKQGDVVGDFCQQIVAIEQGKRNPVIRVGNLNTQRGYTDVRDTIRALQLVMEKGDAGEAYNISPPKATSTQYILDHLLTLSTTKVSVEIDKTKLRPSDEPIILGDATKLVEKTKWNPEIPIEKTLEDALNWWRMRR